MPVKQLYHFDWLCMSCDLYYVIGYCACDLYCTCVFAPLLIGVEPRASDHCCPPELDRDYACLDRARDITLLSFLLSLVLGRQDSGCTCTPTYKNTASIDAAESASVQCTIQPQATSVLG